PISLSRDQIARAQLALAKADDRQNLQTEASQLEQVLKSQPDYRAMYNERFAYETAFKQYLLDIAEYEKWLAKRGEAQARAAAIEPQLESLPALQNDLLMAVSYEQTISLYEMTMIEYTS